MGKHVRYPCPAAGVQLDGGPSLRRFAPVHRFTRGLVRNCYAAPWSVSLYAANSDEALWLITDGGDPDAFPNSVLVEDVAPGYRLAEPLQSPPPENEELKLAFGRGEAYYESLTFRIADLPADGSILAFDGQVMTPDEFTSQGCSDE